MELRSSMPEKRSDHVQANEGFENRSLHGGTMRNGSHGGVGSGGGPGEVNRINPGYGGGWKYRRRCPCSTEITLTNGSGGVRSISHSIISMI